MELHHDKHHAAYVKNLNDALANYPDLQSKPIEDLLKNILTFPTEIQTKVKNHGGGHFNHSFFWQCLSPKPVAPQGKLLDAINATFGSVTAFQEQFSAKALGHFGSGWAWLVSDHDKLSIVDTSNQDSPISQGLTPLLTLDVWEHAYYLKYQNRRADYIAAFWNIVNYPQL
jgi:superoxide dismutase, Fe-Mn family